MQVTIKVIKGRNKKYNNKVFTFNNCKKGTIQKYNLKLNKEFKCEIFDFTFEFNNRTYNGHIENDYDFGWRVSMSGVDLRGTINFDSIEILEIN